jgi:hypothetical protein
MEGNGKKICLTYLTVYGHYSSETFIEVSPDGIEAEVYRECEQYRLPDLFMLVYDVDKEKKPLIMPRLFWPKSGIYTQTILKNIEG